MTTKSRKTYRGVLASLAVLAVAASPAIAPDPASAASYDDSVAGTLPDGTGYGYIVPSDWNGTLIIDSDFIGFGGGVPTPAGANEWLLGEGYAIGGTSRVPTMDRVQESVAALMGGLDKFEAAHGEPVTTIVKGGSLGGFTTRAAIESHPDRLHGAFAMCGGGAGVVGGWNQKLDAAFVANTLLASATNLPLVNITDGDDATAAWANAIADANATDEGRARLALAAAVGQIPTFGDVTDPVKPLPGDFEGQLDHQVAIFNLFIRPQIRSTLEGAAGGNVSWNHGVNYQENLQNSGLLELVEHHYAKAGLNLEADLATLAAEPRISADPAAVAWAELNVVYSGETGDRPVMTIHTSGDRSESLAFDDAYATAFAEAGNSALLRQAWIDRVGHCAFTDAERLAGLMTLIERVETGEWNPTDATTLNARAAQIAADTTIDLGTNTPAYFDAAPDTFLRNWDGRHVGTYGERITVSGVLHDGEPGRVVYEAIKPEIWNGTLILDLDFNGWQQARRDFFLDAGYAIGGNQRTQNQTAYELKDYVDNLVETRQILIDAVEAAGETGEPARTVAWGNSRGGFVVRMAAQYRPDIFDGAIGSAGGGSGVIASTLTKGDAVWALQQLVNPDAGLTVNNLPDNETGNYSPAYDQDQRLNALVTQARSSDQGLARLVLAASFAQMTDFPNGDTPPAETDYETQGNNIANGFAFGNPQFIQKHVEVMSGGPIYFNHGVDYADILDRSGDRDRVEWWFNHAGLDLDAELAKLANAPRLGADPQAIAVAEGITTYTGTGSPVVTLKTRGDPADPAPLDEAYVRTFETSGNGDELLRALLINGSGHGGQTFAEHYAAFQVLEERLDTGIWPDVDPAVMNARVAALQADDSYFGIAAGRYMPFEVTPMVRTWDFNNWTTYRPALSSNLTAGQTVSGTSDAILSVVDANPTSYTAQLFDASGNPVEGVRASALAPTDGMLTLADVNWDALSAGAYTLTFEATYRNGLIASLDVPLVRVAAAPDESGTTPDEPGTTPATPAGTGDLSVTGGSGVAGATIAAMLFLASGAFLLTRRRRSH